MPGTFDETGDGVWLADGVGVGLGDGEALATDDGVGLGVAVGRGVPGGGVAVGRGVGAGVGRGVGAAVGRGVVVGAGVRVGGGAGVGVAPGPGPITNGASGTRGPPTDFAHGWTSWNAATVQAASPVDPATTRMTKRAVAGSASMFGPFPSGEVKVATVGPLPAREETQLLFGELPMDTLETVNPAGTETVTHEIGWLPAPTVTVTFAATPAVTASGDAVTVHGVAALAEDADAVATASPIAAAMVRITGPRRPIRPPWSGGSRCVVSWPRPAGADRRRT